MTAPEETDVLIIGAGPVGLFTAFYAGLRDLKTVVVESLAEVGGQVQQLYPYKTILDVAALQQPQGATLIQQLQTQMQQLPPALHLETTVTDVQPTDTGFLVRTTQGDFRTRAVVLAIGRGALAPKQLPLAVADQVAEQLHYFVADPQRFAGKRVLIAGGGDTALDLALQLAPIAAETALTHRRERFRALEHSVNQVRQADNIQLLTPYQIEAVEATADGGLAVTLYDAQSQTRNQVEVDDLIVSYGFNSDSQAFSNWTVQPVVERQRVQVDRQMQTSVPGLYAVGDIAGYPGKADLIAVGFGEAPQAINALVAQLDPTKAGPMHSSGLQITDGQVAKQR